MRILALAHQWIPDHCAGAEVMLHGMLRALVARGHDVVVLLSRQDGRPYTRDGIEVVPEVDDSHIHRLIGDAHVLVTHLENTPRATLLGKWNRIPVVQVLHNTMRVTKEWTAREPIALAVYNSAWMRNDFEAWAAAEGRTLPPSIVVRPPVDAADYATAPGDRLTLINLRCMDTDSSGFTMGKGAELFWQLAELMPATPFLGVKGAYGNQLVRDDLPNVEVLDHLPHDQMRNKVYARTRVLLMPSSYESWGRTAVEAMASGIPVIAHPTPGLREALADAGLFADRDDIDAWRSHIVDLQHSDDYARRSRLARRRAYELDPTDDLSRWCDAVEALSR